MAKTHSNPIDSANKRRELVPRTEPYFHKLKKGQYLGFRRTVDGGTWTARLIASRQKFYHKLGPEADLTYEDAHDAALAWFKTVVDVEDKNYTVNDAVDAYVDHLKVENSLVASQDTKQRLEKHITDKLGNTELAKLKSGQLRRWLNSLVTVSDDDEATRRSKDSANRVRNSLWAALNLAFRDGRVTSDKEWRKVPPFKKVGAARILFLTDKQVTALIDKAEGGFKSMLEAAKFTGARYGELAAARVRDLNEKEKSLRLDGKTGERFCYLSGPALKWFKEQAKDKEPQALLLPRDDGTQWGKSHQYRPMKAAVKAAELPPETVFYSLRHYHISKALKAGVPVQVVADNCGTSIRMIEKHYGKFLVQDRRRFMNRIKLG